MTWDFSPGGGFAPRALSSRTVGSATLGGLRAGEESLIEDLRAVRAREHTRLLVDLHEHHVLGRDREAMVLLPGQSVLHEVEPDRQRGPRARQVDGRVVVEAHPDYGQQV